MLNGSSIFKTIFSYSICKVPTNTSFKKPAIVDITSNITFTGANTLSSHNVPTGGKCYFGYTA